MSHQNILRCGNQTVDVLIQNTNCIPVNVCNTSTENDVRIIEPIGQKIMDESVAVTIASDQSVLPVDIQNSSIDVNIVNPKGQNNMLNSIPVTIASNQSNVPVTISSPIGQTNNLNSIPITVSSDQCNTGSLTTGIGIVQRTNADVNASMTVNDFLADNVDRVFIITRGYSVTLKNSADPTSGSNDYIKVVPNATAVGSAFYRLYSGQELTITAPLFDNKNNTRVLLPSSWAYRSSSASPAGIPLSMIYLQYPI